MFANDPVLRKILGPGVMAFAIKIGAAALSYLMFIALARTMSLAEYGMFGVGFSWAILLAQVAAAGQPVLAMRLLPGLEGASHAPERHAVLRYLHAALLLATAATLALWMAAGAWADGLPLLYLLAVGAVCATTAMSDMQTGILRAEGEVAGALVPREILWRLAVIGACVPAMAGWTTSWNATFALDVLAILLVLAMIPQVARRRGALAWIRPGPASADVGAWSRMSAWFALSAIISTIVPSMAVVILGWVAPPDETGPFFAALKTSQMLMLIFIAGNIVAGPLFVRDFKRGDTGSVQRVAGAIALAAFLFSLAGAFLLLPLGSSVLRLFGQGFEEAWTSLQILCFGTAIRAALGPSAQVLQMCGAEEEAPRIAFVTSLLTLLLFPFAVLWTGPAGAATVMSIGQVVSAAWSNERCRRRLGVDASILGLFRGRPTGSCA